jgi:hypothetical protein
MTTTGGRAADEMEKIRFLLSTYAVNGDRLRLDELAATFTSDGVLETPTATYTGRDAIRNGLGAGHSRDRPQPSTASAHSFTRHNLTTSNIALDGPDSASGRTYFVVYTDAGLDHLGFYDDELVRDDGGWRFKRRRVRIDWISEQTMLPALLAAHRLRRGV